MMATPNAARKDLEQLVTAVRECRDGDLDLVKVMSFAELMVESVHTYFNSIDKTIYAEIRGIGDYIAKAKGEISNLQAHDLKERHIPEAGRELDEIVKSTENATNTIMEAAERIMEIEATDIETYRTQANDAVMAIFEACSFQDITGQRINKVVETIQYIDTRISRFSETLGPGDGPITLSEEEQSREDRKNNLMLHGPASDGEGICQENIDALLEITDGENITNFDEPVTSDAPKCAASEAKAPVKSQDKPKAKSQPKASPKPAPPSTGDNATDSISASQDDIDALFD